MTILRSLDEGISWQPFHSVDRGAVSYSALQLIPFTSSSSASSSSTSSIGMSESILGLLYERSDNISIVFVPDQILFVPIPL